MKRLRSKSLSSLLCLLMICAFSAPAFAIHPWGEDPPGRKEDTSRQPYRSGQEQSNLIGAEAVDMATTVRSPRSDWLSAAMFEFSFYVYDLLASDEQGQLVAPEPSVRK